MPEPRKTLVVLTSAPTEMEASIIVAALEDQGLQAAMTGQFTAGFRAEAPGWVRVLVAERDLARAEEVLAEIKAERGEIDWSQVDVGEPEEDVD